MSRPLGGDPKVTAVAHHQAHCAVMAKTHEALLANRKRTATKPTTLAGRPLGSIVGSVKAFIVEAEIPTHFHQTLGHYLRPFIAAGERDELEGLCSSQQTDPKDRKPDVCFGPPVPKSSLPRGTKVIGLMWVYTAKSDEHDCFKKVKARLTLMGNQERTELTKYDAYAPVSNPATIRILIARYLGEDGVRFFEDDVSQAFVSTRMVREVYVRHPPGYEIYAKGKRGIGFRENMPGTRGYKQIDTVMRLLLALYGGMECGRLFYDEYCRWHLEYGFRVEHYDRCYFVLKSKDSWIRKSIHVDDGVGAFKGQKLFDTYCSAIKERFLVTFKPLTKSLGIKIDIDYERKIARFSQEDHINKLLARFGMMDCNPKATPCRSGKPPTMGDVPACPKERARLRESFPMRSFVGEINYLQGTTRPELSLPLKILSRFVENFGEAHVKWAKHVLKWLRGTKAYVLVYRCGLRRDIQIFTDASHAGCVDTRRSVSGVVIKYGGNTVMWAANWMKIVAHSSTESELMALDKGATLGMYVKFLVGLVCEEYCPVIDVFVDNSATITLASNPIAPKRNLHVHARFFYIRDLVLNGDYAIHHLATAKQVADLLCSYKGEENFRQLYAYLMGCCCVVLDAHGVTQWDTSLLSTYC